MLSKLVKEHNSLQQLHREEQEKRKNEAVVAAQTMSSAVVDHLNRSAYYNQKKLDSDAKKMKLSASDLCQQVSKWEQVAYDFNQVFKEMGDVENWIETIQDDMRYLSQALSIVVRKTQEVMDNAKFSIGNLLGGF